MPKTDRRTLLKTVAAGAAATALPQAAHARARKLPPPEAEGLLYDTTKCIGCKACMAACKVANDLPADTSTYGDGLYDAPDGLNEYTKNLIALYKSEDGSESSFVKRQCMHCIDPACVGACMIGALQKDKVNGIVAWDGDRCIGCRYCATVCPFNIPKFEWSKAMPKLIKCELCSKRTNGKGPACAEVCPRGAVIYGKRTELLQIAKARLEANPGAYVPKIYGETELGGTQCLYLSHVEFEKLGFRFSEEEPVPELQQVIQHGTYKGFIAPAALYAILGLVTLRNRKKADGEGGKA